MKVTLRKRQHDVHRSVLNRSMGRIGRTGRGGNQRDVARTIHARVPRVAKLLVAILNPRNLEIRSGTSHMRNDLPRSCIVENRHTVPTLMSVNGRTRTPHPPFTNSLNNRTPSLSMTRHNRFQLRRIVNRERRNRNGKLLPSNISVWFIHILLRYRMVRPLLLAP